MSFRQIKSFDLTDYNLANVNNEEYEDLSEQAKLLKEIFEDLNCLVQNASEPLDDIATKTDNTIEYVEKGNIYLTKAVKSNKTKNTIVLVSLASLLGMCIGGPLGGVGAAGISTAAIGFATVSSILSGAIIGGLTGAGALGGVSGVCYNIIKK